MEVTHIDILLLNLSPLLIFFSSVLVHECTHLIIGRLEGYNTRLASYNTTFVLGEINSPKQIRWTILSPLIITPIYIIVVSIVLQVHILFIVALVIFSIYICKKDIAIYLLIQKLFKQLGKLETLETCHFHLQDKDVHGLTVCNVNKYYMTISQKIFKEA